VLSLGLTGIHEGAGTHPGTNKQKNKNKTNKLANFLLNPDSSYSTSESLFDGSGGDEG